MFDINIWIDEIASKIKNTFGDNLLFLGYQGSYRRGEATNNSDIDIVIILAKLGIKELKEYKKIINSMPQSEKACGFISSKEELKNWLGCELFQLYNDTKAVYGDMKDLIPEITADDAKFAAKIGAQNVYHMACHSYLYNDDPKAVLKDLYKSIAFVLQAEYFVQSGEYVLTKKELYTKLPAAEKEIMEPALNRNIIDDFTQEQIEASYAELIEFCSKIIKRYN